MTNDKANDNGFISLADKLLKEESHTIAKSMSFLILDLHNNVFDSYLIQSCRIRPYSNKNRKNLT